MTRSAPPLEYAPTPAPWRTRRMLVPAITAAAVVLVASLVFFVAGLRRRAAAPPPVPPPVVTTTDWVERNKDGKYLFCQYRVTVSNAGPISFGWDNPAFPGNESWEQRGAGEFRLHILRESREGSLVVMDLLTGPDGWGGAQVDMVPFERFRRGGVRYTNLITGTKTLVPGSRVNLLRVTGPDGFVADLWLQVH